MKIPYKSKELPVLITNNHVLDKNDIDNNIKITLQLNNGKITKILSINDNNRLTYTSDKYDITILEIKENKDKLDNKYLELDDYITKFEPDNLKNIYSNESIYLIGYPEDKNVLVSYGKPPKFEDTYLNHFCSTKEGSSGSPILKIKNQKLIGIHIGNHKNKWNRGALLIYAINEFQNKNKVIKKFDNSLINFKENKNSLEKNIIKKTINKLIIQK